MTPRQKRIADLMAARDRIEAELARLGQSLDDLPTTAPKQSLSRRRAALMARDLVWNGCTHAEVAQALKIQPEAVAWLIAPERTRETEAAS